MSERQGQLGRAACGLLALCLAACGGPPRVSLDDVWPAAPLPYEDAYRRATRTGSVTSGLDSVMTVAATLLTPEWRAAFVDEHTRRALLSAADSTLLRNAEELAASESWEVEFVVATTRTAWNDFAKRDRSMWRMTLVGDDGREVRPVTVVADTRAREEVRAYFPRMGYFTRAYRVRFPRNGDDGRPLVTESSDRLALKVGSGLGGVELIWLTQ